MAYSYADSRITPAAPITAVSGSYASVGALPTGWIRPGFRALGKDPSLGEAVFIYLPTVASVTSGSVVTYRESASGVFTVAVVPNTANLAQPLAVSMHTGAANNYGWFALAGVVKVKKTAVKVNPNVVMYISATTGRLMSTAASGKQILGLRASNSATVASATSTVIVTINYPHAQGAVT